MYIILLSMALNSCLGGCKVLDYSAKTNPLIISHLSEQ